VIRGALALALALLLVPRAAAADLMPGQEACGAPPHLECVSGTLDRETIEGDACTAKELKRLGLRFHCEQSNNDRGTIVYCRRRTLPREPAELTENATDAQIEARAEKYLAWYAVYQRELGYLGGELSFGSYSERYFDEMAARNRQHRDAAPPPPNPNRLDCFGLYYKYKRCAIELDRCTPYWTKYRELAGKEFGEDLRSFERDQLAAQAIAAVQGRRPRRGRRRRLRGGDGLRRGGAPRAGSSAGTIVPLRSRSGDDRRRSARRRGGGRGRPRDAPPARAVGASSLSVRGSAPDTPAKRSQSCRSAMSLATSDSLPVLASLRRK